MKRTKPTKAQLAFLQAVEEETVATVENTEVRWSRRSGTTITARYAVMRLDGNRHGIGKPFAFAMVVRCEARGWIRRVKGIFELTNKGRAALGAQVPA